jgi:hypothetical protein
MRVKNVSDAIITISKENISSSLDAALLTRDATLQPGAELVIYDYIAENLVSLRDLITRGQLVIVNSDQPSNAPTIGIPGYGSGSAATTIRGLFVSCDGFGNVYMDNGLVTINGVMSFMSAPGGTGFYPSTPSAAGMHRLAIMQVSSGNYSFKDGVEVPLASVPAYPAPDADNVMIARLFTVANPLTEAGEQLTQALIDNDVPGR